jgi:hypothetical protein
MVLMRTTGASDKTSPDIRPFGPESRWTPFCLPVCPAEGEFRSHEDSFFSGRTKHREIGDCLNHESDPALHTAEFLICN